MASRLINVVATGSVAAGALAVLTHSLQRNGVALVPDYVEPDNPNFTYVTASSTTVTVRNDGAGTDSCNVWCERKHSIERALGGAANLSTQPFAARGGTVALGGFQTISGAQAVQYPNASVVVYDGTDLQTILNALSVATQVVYSDRVVGTHVIVFPPRPNNVAWDIGDVDVPANLSVSFVGTSAMSSWLNYTGSRGYMFQVLGTKWGNCTFQDLFFVGGGIAFAGGVRRHQAIINCVFQDITGPAVRTLGASVIDVRVQRCWFNRCGGGVHVLHTACDIWVIDHCIFNRNTDVDVKLDSSGVAVLDCDFETRNINNLDRPYIQITFGQVYICRNRFGPEVDGTASPPQYAVVVGGLGGQEVGTIPDVLIDGNVFEGTNPYGASSTPYPNDSSSKAAIRLSKALTQSSVTNNRFRRYATGIVHEDWAAGTTPGTCSWLGNRQSAVPDTNGFVPPVFFGRTNYADGWALDDGQSTSYLTVSPGTTNNLAALGFGPWTQQVQATSTNNAVLTGFNTGVGGQKIRPWQVLEWLNVSAFNHTFNSEDNGSTAEFRLRTVGGAPLVCPTDGLVRFQYDPNISRWRVVGKNF